MGFNSAIFSWMIRMAEGFFGGRKVPNSEKALLYRPSTEKNATAICSQEEVAETMPLDKTVHSANEEEHAAKAFFKCETNDYLKNSPKLLTESHYPEFRYSVEVKSMSAVKVIWAMLMSSTPAQVKIFDKIQDNRCSSNDQGPETKGCVHCGDLHDNEDVAHRHWKFTQNIFCPCPPLCDKTQLIACLLRSISEELAVDSPQEVSNEVTTGTSEFSRVQPDGLYNLRTGTEYCFEVTSIFEDSHLENEIDDIPEPVDTIEQYLGNIFFFVFKQFENEINDVPEPINTTKQDLRSIFTMYNMEMPIYILNSGGDSFWRWTKRIIKRYAMLGTKKGKKRKRIFTETQVDLKCPDGKIKEITAMDSKSSGVWNIEEIFHEIHSVIEGPAEVPLMQPPPNSKGYQSRQGQPRHVVADGIISDIANDPPGQQTRYIPPGDNRREAYRLSTFEQFPNKSVKTALLAKHGFVYTGFYDRVKCFSCARTVESWDLTDNPADRKWHKNDCSFMLGHPTGNVPLGGGLLGGLRNTLTNQNASQLMDHSPSYSAQNTGAAYVQIPNDRTDRQSGGTYQIQPGQSIVIGAGSQPTPAAPSPARNPPRQWRMANVISADHKRHLTNLYLNRELDRLASFARWPTGRPNVAPVSLARAGFFYLGDMDRTQCFSCGGVLRNWSAADIAMDEHRTHFPNCRFVVGVERRNVPIPNEPETPQELAEKYPRRFPMNPHMRSEPSRVQTFDRRWPIGRTRAQPQEIAAAGFFFLGERDRVKCWYCNGGLQNWEYDDIPWIEHAKWFPNCQFLLATKGQLFVHEHLSNCPHLPRPIIARQDGAVVDTSTATVHSSAPPRSGPSLSPGRDVPPPSATRVRAPSPPPAIIDPQEERRKQMERIDKEMNEGEAVKLVRAMGYEDSLIRRTLLDKLESGTPHDAENIFDGNAALLDAVMQKEGEVKQEEEEEQATGVKFPSISSNYSSFQMESMDTSASLGHTSGVNHVSGFDSDDEDRDLYGGGTSKRSTDEPIGYVGGAVFASPSPDGETTVKSHLWDDVPSDPESMKEFIEQKKEERLCKICFTEPADMVFLPCSHMACCLTCTQALRTCPVCRTRIEKAVKTYTK